MSPAHFNPRAPYGARLEYVPLGRYYIPISIHAPHTGRDWNFESYNPPISHFNPRAPYGARRFGDIVKRREITISIHAPHTGRDPLSAMLSILTTLIFQSTRPIRGATRFCCLVPPSLHFNPRAPYGARRLASK